MQMVAQIILGERDADSHSVSGRRRGGDPPQAMTGAARERPERLMTCKEANCGRRSHSLGYCTTHYRRWRAGRQMDAPIRRYARRGKLRRERPFAAEYALLAELGLRRR